MLSKTVVLVDDSPFILLQLETFFQQKLGFHVLAKGEDGNEAVELYRRHKPDLITMDVTMPKKDGIEAIQEILREYPEAKILVISAVRGNGLLECLDYGAKSYVEKPLKLNDTSFVEEFEKTILEIA